MKFTLSAAELDSIDRISREVRDHEKPPDYSFFCPIRSLASLSCSGQGIGPDTAGNLPPVSQPPWPERIPGYMEVDPATGLHMTGTPQHIDIAGYRLKVTGKVDRPLNLSFDELRRLPRLTAKPALICQGYFEDHANWAGASLTAILDRAGVRAEAREVDLIGADGYYLGVFRTALDARYGPSTSFEQFATKAQVMSYEGERAMFEAFGRNKYRATGVIQWMLNNAWPSMIWHLYDYYLRPGGSYFGAKKACEPLHIQYSYDDRSIAVVNSYYRDFQGLRATAKVYNMNMSEKYSHEAAFDISADGVRKLFAIPEIQDLSPVYFVQLTLADSAGKVVGSNFYWLSTKEDVLDWENSTWYHTPSKAFSDLTALNSLPRVELRVAATAEVTGADRITHVTIENPTPHLAFSVHLKVVSPPRGPETAQGEILPVLWQDNYFALLPGEKREIAARSRISDSGPGPKLLEVDGWNLAPESVPVQ